MINSYAHDDMSLQEWFDLQDDKNWPVGALVRAKTCLHHHGYKTVGDVRREGDSDLIRIPNLGKVTLKALRANIGVFSQECMDNAPDQELLMQVERLKGENAALKQALEMLIDRLKPP